MKREIIEWVKTIVISIVIALLITTFVKTNYRKKPFYDSYIRRK